jgi:phosphoserine phosphatase
VAEPFGKLWGFDHVFGTELHVDDQGAYHGTPDRTVVHARNKGEVLSRLVAELDLTFDGSIAIGDALSDASMLEVVQHPILFNPSPELLRRFYGSRRSYLVLERRVIYKTRLDRGSSDGMLPEEVEDRLALDIVKL